jgi:hypothetical protein
VPKDSGPVSSADASPPEVVPVPKKKVELSVNPSDAHVFKGGEELAQPWVIEVEKGKSVELEFRREGYKSKKMSFDGTQEKVAVKLEKEVKVAPPPSNTGSNTKPPDPPPTQKPERPFEDFE